MSERPWSKSGQVRFVNGKLHRRTERRNSHFDVMPVFDTDFELH